MVIDDFKNAIKGRLFILLKTWDDVNTFTANPTGSNPFRDAAYSAGVIVFLEKIQRIWTHGTYYSISKIDFQNLQAQMNDLEVRVGRLNAAFQTFRNEVLASIDDININLNDVHRFLGDIENKTLGEVIEEHIDAVIGDYVTQDEFNSFTSAVAKALDEKMDVGSVTWEVQQSS